MKELSSYFHETGKDFDDFALIRETLESKTYVRNVNFNKQKVSLWLFMDVTENDEIYVLKLDEEIIDSIGKWRPGFDAGALQNKAKMDGKKLPTEILEDIKNGTIPIALEAEGHFMFCDQNCISRFTPKLGIQFSLIYEKNYIGMMALYSALKSYSDVLVLNIRYDEGYRRVMSVMSEKTVYHAAAPIVKKMCMQTGFFFKAYDITQYRTKVVLDGETIGNYHFFIRMDFSDTGHGNEKYLLCIRPVNGRNFFAGIVLQKFKMDEISQMLALKEKVKNLLLTSDKIISGKQKILKSRGLKTAIGKKRLAGIDKELVEGTDLLLYLVELPEKIGSINNTSDRGLAESAGELFLELLNIAV